MQGAAIPAAAATPSARDANVMLLHGFFSCADAWGPLRQELGGSIQSFAPPQLGYSGEHGCGRYTLEALVEHLAPIAEREGPTHVVGHSMGAIVALALARELPGQFARIGVVGLPVFHGRTDAVAFLRRHGIVYRAFLQADDVSHVACVALHHARYAWAPFSKFILPRQPRDAVVGAFDHCRASHRGGLRDVVFSGCVEELAAGVETPVAALHGSHDRTAPPGRAATLAGSLQWDFELAPGQGHQNVVERPRYVARWLREHVLVPAPAA